MISGEDAAVTYETSEERSWRCVQVGREWKLLVTLRKASDQRPIAEEGHSSAVRISQAEEMERKERRWNFWSRGRRSAGGIEGIRSGKRDGPGAYHITIRRAAAQEETDAAVVISQDAAGQREYQIFRQESVQQCSSSLVND